MRAIDWICISPKQYVPAAQGQCIYWARQWTKSKTILSIVNLDVDEFHRRHLLEVTAAGRNWRSIEDWGWGQNVTLGEAFFWIFGNKTGVGFILLLQQQPVVINKVRKYGHDFIELLEATEAWGLGPEDEKVPELLSEMLGNAWKVTGSPLSATIFCYTWKGSS